MGPPTVIEKTDNGERMEPFELVDVEIPEEYSGSCISLLNERKGNMIDMSAATAEGQQTIQFEVPARTLHRTHPSPHT